jgi:hypothetical protein
MLSGRHPRDANHSLPPAVWAGTQTRDLGDRHGTQTTDLCLGTGPKQETWGTGTGPKQQTWVGDRSLRQSLSPERVPVDGLVALR